MWLKMSQIAAEVTIKLISVLIEKKPIQPHSEVNALTGGNSVGFHGIRGSGILHINSLKYQHFLITSQMTTLRIERSKSCARPFASEMPEVDGELKSD